MNIEISHLAAAVFASIAVLGIIGYIMLRRSRPAYPVKCIHCFQYLDTETIVSYSDRPGQWAICSECVKKYWDLN
ncbi:MAG: hypothetical protein ABIJ42_04030 [Acidobacteriota bacterium]